jgi:hypothetical protein
MSKISPSLTGLAVSTAIGLSAPSAAQQPLRIGSLSITAKYSLQCGYGRDAYLLC